MWTTISVLLALIISFFDTEISKNIKSTQNNYQESKILTGLGFPHEYFEGEILTDEMVESRLQLIYISLIIYITILFSSGLTLSTPVLEQTLLTSTTTSIKRLIPNELNSQPNKQELVLKIRGGAGNSIPELIIKILFIWTMTQNSKTTEGFKQNPINQRLGREIQGQPNPRMAPKLRENPVDGNNPAQRSCKSEGNNRIKTGILKDGSVVHVDSSQIRDKSHHMEDFISREDLEGKFDINYLKSINSYQERLKYVRSKNNLPDYLVHKMQDEVLKFITDNKTMSIPGFIGNHKQEGTVFVNLEMRKVGFYDYGSNKFRTALSMDPKKIKNLANEGFHLFPNSNNP
jgi:hypothetical protein